MSKRIAALLIAGAAALTAARVGIGSATAGTTGTTEAGGSAGVGGTTDAAAAAGLAHRKTLQLTHAMLAAFEREDLRTMSAMTADRATLTHPMPLSGDRESTVRFVGKEQVLGYYSQVFTGMSRIDFTDVRVTVSADGRTSFVQANGDFTTADGRPYLNVYLFRYNWQNGQAVSGDEYANPVTFCQTFGHPTCVS